MIEVDCSELTLDQQLALASTISESLAGRAVGLVRDTKIVLDTISGNVSLADVEQIVSEFVSKRKESQYYSVEVKGRESSLFTARIPWHGPGVGGTQVRCSLRTY